MQGQSKQNLTFHARLEKLKLDRGWTGEQAAKALGLSRTMIHFIRSGKHGVTAKTWHRLEQAERSAQVTNENLPGSEPLQGLASVLSTAAGQSRVQVSAADIDRGYIDIPLEYRRGEPPKGAPTKLRVKAPTSLEASRALAAIRLDQGVGILLAACLPEEFAMESFLNKLTPFCYEEITSAALAMTFGVHWQRLIKAPAPRG